MSTKPILFLTFANDRSVNGEYLRNLGQEKVELDKVLKPVEQVCQIEIHPSATVDNVLEVFNNSSHKGNIVLFHYAGHAKGDKLMLEGLGGKQIKVDTRGLAKFLGQQSGLQLVFLNACSTRTQAQELLDAGIAVVIATSRGVDDYLATTFAQIFYTALVGGATIHKSFVNAQMSLGLTSDEIKRRTRSLGDKEDQHSSNEGPWEIYFRDGEQKHGEWSLADATNDPLFGVPPLPQMDLPNKPFLYLSWFSRDMAPIFFGRGKLIRKLYFMATDEVAAPIILVYGPSGVGKSSLLEAGLLPRLEQKHTVIYMRRDIDKVLLGTLLHHIPASDGSEKKLRDIWCAAEKPSARRRGKPLTLLLDQVEEIYTRPNKEKLDDKEKPDDKDEMEEFLSELVPLYSKRDKRPRGKLILSFRKEWLAEIEKRLIDHGLPFNKVLIEPLDEDGVKEAVEGIARTEALKQKYRLEIEDELPTYIAQELLSDSDALIAPMLQILLTRLWDEATRRSDPPRFDRKLCVQLRQDGLRLDQFLDNQLKHLAEDQSKSAQFNVVKSGLALDLLYFHTTEYATTKQRSFEELCNHYTHQKETLLGLVSKLKDLYLLADAKVDGVPNSPDKPTSRLAHDTLAPYVRSRFEQSTFPGQRARRILAARMIDWDGKDDPSNRTPLDQQDLGVVEAGEVGMRTWNDVEMGLIAASRKKRKQENRAKLIWRCVGIIAVLLTHVTQQGVQAQTP